MCVESIHMLKPAERIVPYWVTFRGLSKKTNRRDIAKPAGLGAGTESENRVRRELEGGWESE
jgi:hypothetical protein